jgi:iron complex outermembrane receptor protein
LELDLWGRYVDDLPIFNVDDYVTLDMRLAWRPRADITLALVGRNLLEQQHQEYAGNNIEREVYGRLEWLF